jgi:hypothetical protein
LDFAKFLAGAALGGTVGYYAFFWVASQGFYALVLPGFLLGLGAGFFPCRKRWWAYLAGTSALALGLYTEWRFAPFKADDSLLFFLSHLSDLKPLTWIMVSLGGYLGYQAPAARFQNELAQAYVVEK